MLVSRWRRADRLSPRCLPWRPALAGRRQVLSKDGHVVSAASIRWPLSMLILDVLLRGILVIASMVLGGVVWSRLIYWRGRAGAGGRRQAVSWHRSRRGRADRAGHRSRCLVAPTELRTAAAGRTDFLETPSRHRAKRIALALDVTTRQGCPGPAGRWPGTHWRGGRAAGREPRRC